MAARVIWDHEAAGSRPATETSFMRVLGCGRSSMAEPWAVNPLVPVRLRPVTPKRMPFDASRTRAAENRALTPEGQGCERFALGLRPAPAARPTPPALNKPLATHHPSTPSWRNRQTHRSQKPEPQGMSVRLGPRGPASSPVAQRQSSALIRRRPVDRAHPGRPATSEDLDHQPPRRCAMKPINEDDVCFHGHEQTAQRLPV
jgi:hypothetical protein